MKMETEPASEILCIFKKSDDEQKSQKGRLFQLTFVVLCSLIRISWPLKLGLQVCPEMSVRNYHTALCIISEEHRFYMIWQCRLWFGPLWSGSE